MKFHHVALTVKDFSISVPFYENLFGLKEVTRFRRDDMGGTGCMLQNENVIIELWQFDEYKQGTREGLEFSGIKHIAFTDDDPEAVRSSFLNKGFECRPLSKGASGGVYFFLTDPDGNEIEIYKPAISF